VEFVLFVVGTFLAIEVILYGVRLLRKERMAFKALGKRIAGDAKVLTDETEEFLKGLFRGKS